MPKVLVPLAQGCEELEAVTIIDLLRRAEIIVVTAGLDTNPVTASRGTVLIPDTDLDTALKDEYDMLVLPGGLPGADYLENDQRIRNILMNMANSEKFTAAICAAPKILSSAGLLKGKRATCYPTILESDDDTDITGEAVVIDGKIITSRGPGTAMDFALSLIEVLQGKERREQVENSLQR